MQKRKLIGLGFLMLLAASYLDNVRGPLIPVLAEGFHISYGTTTWFLVLGNLGAVFALVALLPVLQTFSVSTVSKFLCGFFFLLMGFVTNVQGLTGLFIFAALLGGLVPVYGALANLFLIQGTSEKERSKWLCALHMCYGIASLTAPLIVSILIGKKFPWYSPFLAYLPVAALTLFALYLKGKKKEEGSTPVAKEALGLRESQWLPIGIFCSYVAGEVMISVWMTSYLKEVWFLSLEKSAPYLSGFFMLMTLSRAVCFFSLTEKTEKKMLFGCLVFSALGLVVGHSGFLLGFVFAGVLGPFFPLFLSQCSQKFAGHSRSFTLWVIASTQVALAGINLVVGELIGYVGMEKAYKIPVFLLGFSLLLLGIFYLKEKRESHEY